MARADVAEVDVVLGAKLFKRTCAPCHGKEGKGDGPAAAGMARTP